MPSSLRAWFVIFVLGLANYPCWSAESSSRCSRAYSSRADRDEVRAAVYTAGGLVLGFGALLGTMTRTHGLFTATFGVPALGTVFMTDWLSREVTFLRAMAQTIDELAENRVGAGAISLAGLSNQILFSDGDTYHGSAPHPRLNIILRNKLLRRLNFYPLQPVEVAEVVRRLAKKQQLCLLDHARLSSKRWFLRLLDEIGDVRPFAHIENSPYAPATRSEVPSSDQSFRVAFPTT